MATPSRHRFAVAPPTPDGETRTPVRLVSCGAFSPDGRDLRRRMVRRCDCSAIRTCMRQLPSRLRRLDDALADLPLDEPMLLTELDGFLTGLLVSPEIVVPGEWLPMVWRGEEGGGGPFEDPIDVQWFVDSIMARHNEIVRDLGRGKPKPIFEIDERNGDVLWDLWMDGFAEAMALRPESWAALSEGSDAANAVSRLSLLIAIARNESILDSMEINAISDRAPAEISANILALHGWRMRSGATAAASPVMNLAKVGRNEPCPCGSEKKFKRCCG